MGARDGQPRGADLARKRRGPRLYGRRWDKTAKGWLRSHPLCVDCERRGYVVAATVVDHIIAHRGDAALFWDRDNWQSLCKTCHDSQKQSEEARGYSSELGLDGWPIDPRHPANAGDGVAGQISKAAHAETGARQTKQS